MQHAPTQEPGLNVSDTAATIQPTESFTVGDWRVEPQTLRLFGQEGESRLEPKTMQLLVYLAQHHGQVVTRAQLEAAVWSGRVVTDDALTNAITKLRRAFQDSARQPQVIETIPKTGYRLIAPVGAPEPSPTPQPTPQQAEPESRRAAPLLSRSLGLAGVALLLVLLAWFSWQPDAPEPVESPSRPRVAVLPFDNLGPSPQQDYFVDGITRDLITDLSKLAGLEVIAPGSTFVYRNAQPDVRQAGESLRADYIVRGSVQRSGQRLRINAQLIAVDDERAVWAERLDTTLEHVFRVQDQIARGVVGALRLALVADQPLHHGAASIAAYDALLLGLEAYGHRSPDGNQLAREHLEQAVALDPGYARAHAGLALVYAREAIDGWTPTPAESLRRAEQQAQTALKLDPAMSQGYFVQGQVALFQGRQADAIAAAERAITIDPSYADAYALSAWILNFAGRPDQALQALASAESLNPITPLSYREILGEIRFAQGRYAEAIEHLGEVVQQNPGHQRAIMWLAAALARQGRLEDARWEVEKLRLSLEDGTPGPLAFALPFKDPRIRDELLRSLEQAGWGPEPL